MDIKIENGITTNEYNYLRKSINWNLKDNHIVEKAIINSTIIKKAIVNNQTVGMARAIGDGIYYFIVDVIVDLEYQKKGIGKKLIEEIINEIENNTEQGQTCSINLLSIDGKEEFYEKCGFTKVPFGYTGYGMIKRIEK